MRCRKANNVLTVEQDRVLNQAYGLVVHKSTRSKARQPVPCGSSSFHLMEDVHRSRVRDDGRLVVQL